LNDDSKKKFRRELIESIAGEKIEEKCQDPGWDYDEEPFGPKQEQDAGH
jgi:hypothetical protein